MGAFFSTSSTEPGTATVDARIGCFFTTAS
jgi:hypothetical protein